LVSPRSLLLTQDGRLATAGAEAATAGAVVASTEEVLVVVAVVDTPEGQAGGRRVQVELVRAEAEWASTGRALVVARVTTIAEACFSLIRAPGSFVLQFIDRPPLRERIAG
jgi:hypothetical protein